MKSYSYTLQGWDGIPFATITNHLGGLPFQRTKVAAFVIYQLEEHSRYLLVDLRDVDEHYSFQEDVGPVAYDDEELSSLANKSPRSWMLRSLEECERVARRFLWKKGENDE